MKELFNPGVKRQFSIAEQEKSYARYYDAYKKGGMKEKSSEELADYLQHGEMPRNNRLWLGILGTLAILTIAGSTYYQDQQRNNLRGEILNELRKGDMDIERAITILRREDLGDVNKRLAGIELEMAPYARRIIKPTQEPLVLNEVR